MTSREPEELVTVCCWIVTVNPAFVVVNTDEKERLALPAGKVHSDIRLKPSMATKIQIPLSLAKKNGLTTCT